MRKGYNNDIPDFFIAGINYRKTDAAIRSQFAINQAQYTTILSIAPSYGIHEVFILSTCNRTEIYGFAENAGQLIQLLCTQTAGGTKTFEKLAYIKKGDEAVSHLFNVGAGLDSQILGDYEIVGQIRQAVQFARQHHFIGARLDRLVSSVLQSSKVIKNQTAISGGTVSVSFAAVQYIKQNVTNYSAKSILLLGIGKIGRNTCKNLVDYLRTTNITLINRSPGKAEELAKELGLHYALPDDLARYIQQSDIIIVATNAVAPTILRSHLENHGNKVIIDLSIPYNVEAEARELPNITLVNVDTLSAIKDNTVKKREAEIPKAKAIIDAYTNEFLQWNEMRKHVPVLKAVKNKLHEINSSERLWEQSANLMPSSYDPQEKIQKVINLMAIKMRRQHQHGCHYIEAINDFMG
ncbi:MAG: glutamyl-tRNA reductase [Chitinophagaceae bacterium]